MFEIVKLEGETRPWAWNLRLNAGGRILATSEQSFAKRSAVIADIQRVKKMAADAPVHEVL